MMLPRFTSEDMRRANETWGANCGPGSIAAIFGMTLDEVRPFMAAEGFETKRYTNPRMMLAILRRLNSSQFRRPWLIKVDKITWPNWGLARIQWEGPWTNPGVPMRARYRHTHWVGAATGKNGVGIFDINAMGNGSGWCPLTDWVHVIVPWILEECVPRASGGYHLTHSIEVGASA